MTSTNIQVIEMQGVRVLTTAQLAESYGTESQIITNNFNRNKGRYEEGKHYIRLTGAEKREFCNLNQIDVGTKAANFYLWTERGALLHAKSLNTDTAWEVYDQLVETYFRAKKAQAALNELSPQLQLMIKFETEQNALKAKVADIEQRLDSMTAEPDPEPPKALPKKWSERETDYLRKAYALGQTDTEIAADLGRTEDSVRTKRWRIGLESNDRNFKYWSPVEDRKLIKLAKLGVSCSDIAKTIGRSPEGVQRRKSRLKKAGRL
jgi:DNA-directed RNA polymerase specialized sigma24 family protein